MARLTKKQRAERKKLKEEIASLESRFAEAQRKNDIFDSLAMEIWERIEDDVRRVAEDEAENVYENHA